MTIRRVHRLGVRTLSVLSCGWGVLTLTNRTNHTTIILPPEPTSRWLRYLRAS